MDKLSVSARSANMSKIRAKDTKPEMLVRKLIHAMGFRYRLHVADLPGKPDIVLPRHKCIIEVHGCFWHQHAGCKEAHIPKSRMDYWQPKLERNVRRGRKNHKVLRELGFRILTIWECQTRFPLKLEARIRKFLLHPGSNSVT